jgi:Na+/H+-dicarboxylate symporter
MDRELGHKQLQETEHKIMLLFAKSEQTNSFKMWMSITFATLVGSVIAGFFFIAGKDRSVRASTFAHEVGIQFITLFSLVIAIILLGIIGVLEGKELAALLGGLSGYILGRGAGGSRVGTSLTAAVVPGERKEVEGREQVASHDGRNNDQQIPDPGTSRMDHGRDPAVSVSPIPHPNA